MDLKMMQSGAIAVIGLSAITLTAIAVVTGFKTSGALDVHPNDSLSGTGNSSADSFITGLTIFATFIGVIILAIVGKIIVGLFKKE